MLIKTTSLPIIQVTTYHSNRAIFYQYPWMVSSEGDFTMVFGFPGSTNEYLPSESIKQITDLSVDPVKVALRTRALDIMHKYMVASEAVKIKYVTKAAGISNGWKKWQGEMEGVEENGCLW